MTGMGAMGGVEAGDGGTRVAPAGADLEAVLAAHPAVGRVTLAAGGDGRVLAHVVPAGAARGDDAGHVRAWEGIYDSLYGDAADGPPDADFAGWTSSYTGRPIPLAEMREWRAATVARIEALGARRVLEIGAGSGLLLFRLAAACETYWATDVSGEAVDRLDEAAGADPALRDRVVLRQLAAHEFDDLPAGHFDLVIMNSVVQYFPGPGYLTDVLRGAAGLLAPGGAVFAGDVRNLRSHRCLAAAVQVAQAGPDADPGELRDRARRAVALEKEMLVDPGFFAELPAAVPALSRADVLVKRGRHHNELTRHRYDVILRTEPAPPRAPDGRAVVDWGSGTGDLAALEARLSEPDGPDLLVTGVPDARLAGELATMRALETGRIVRAAAGGGVDPEQLHELGERHGRRVLVTFSGACGHVDALFTRDPHAAAPRVPSRAGRPATNDPAASRFAADLRAELRQLVRRRMPGSPLPTIVIEPS